jgi:hypothetical protein
MLNSSALVLTVALTIGQDSFPSGPPVGEKLGGFKAHAFSGPDAGKEFKLLENAKGRPTLVIFMHAAAENGITRPGLQFLRPVDKYAADNDKLATHIIWITGDKEKTEGFLKRAENSLKLQSPISICLEGGKDGPAAYGLNDKVAITVLVAKDNKVVANFALTDPNGNDSRKVILAIAKVLGKDPPKEEKKEEKKREEKKGKFSPELQKLMRQMINKDNSADQVKSIAEDMKKWAGDDEKRMAELRAYAKFVVDLNYGTDDARAALKTLAKE